MLQYSFINNQGICPNVSAVIQLDEVAGIGLTYELSLLSSYGCVLQDCPMLVRPGRRVLNITLMDGENYTAMLVVSNDCGSDSTAVLIQPGGEGIVYVRICRSVAKSGKWQQPYNVQTEGAQLITVDEKCLKDSLTMVLRRLLVYVTEWVEELLFKIDMGWKNDYAFTTCVVHVNETWLFHK